MAKRKNNAKTPEASGATVGYEAQLWQMADALRGSDGQIAHGDTFHNDRHPDLKADFILANPPFNNSVWGGERLADDPHWQYGTPPKGNANFAWIPKQ